MGIGKGYVSIKDRLFTKKLISFLHELKEIPIEQRNKQLQQIEESDKYTSNVGEKILFIIEKTSDNQKSSFVGKLFAAYLKEEITYKDFIRCAEIVNKANIYSLIELINGEFTGVPIDDDEDYINSGLFVIEEPKLELLKNNKIESVFGEELGSTDFKLKEVEWSGVISKYGKLIREVMRK